MYLSSRARADTRRLGQRGEEAAVRLLKHENMTILARNYRCKAGELDIVALDGRELVFVEVKSLRKKAFFTPASNLSMNQRRRNRNAAKVYLRMINSPQISARFDLVEAVYWKNILLSIRRTEDYQPPLILR